MAHGINLLFGSSRAGRITASNMHVVYAPDVWSPALSTIKKMCYPKDSNCIIADLTWGTTHEEEGLHPKKQGTTQ